MTRRSRTASRRYRRARRHRPRAARVSARGERVAFYLDKRFETVATAFGAAHAGAVFVPVNPLLKAEQVGHILRDCNVRVIVTSAERLDAIAATLAECPDLRHVVVIGASADGNGRPGKANHRPGPTLSRIRRPAATA